MGILKETRRSLSEVAAELGLSRQTIEKWHLRGARGHKLEVLRLGGKIVTSAEAVQRFLERCNATP
jgi:predicted transcriptional regulator